MGTERQEAPSVGDEVIQPGAMRRIAFMRLASGRQPARSFLDGLPREQKATFMLNFKKIADGQILDGRKFHRVKDTKYLWEFKNPFNNRFLCFFAPPNYIILVEGVRKPGQYLPQDRVDAADRRCAEFMAAIDGK